MKSCWYKAVVGTDPKVEDCKRLHPNGCDDCSYFMPDPPEGYGDQDEMPDFDLKQPDERQQRL